MSKPPKIPLRLASIQRELEEAVDLYSKVPMDINHPNLVSCMYKVQCCRNHVLNLLKQLQQ